MVRPRAGVIQAWYFVVFVNQDRLSEVEVGRRTASERGRFAFRIRLRKARAFGNVGTSDIN